MRTLVPRWLLVLSLATPLLGPPPLLAQAGAPAPDAERAVMETVNRLFDGMRARDGAMVASVFHPEARMVSTGFGPDGAPRVQIASVDGFVNAVGQEGDPWNEPIFRPEVRVDGNLAQVWVFYRFYLGDAFSHCGHNAFQLVDEGHGWQIIALADSRRNDDCEAPG